MHIVADEHIPYVQEAFSTIGEVTTCSGRDIGSARVQEADALIVRTITSVDATLLKKSRVQFVATATSGTEHIDIDFLRVSGIGFAHAQGANARSVAEYVLAALLEVIPADSKPFTDYRCGIVGYGHVGSTVHALLKQCGIHCVIYDPFLEGTRDDIAFATWEDICQQDIITFHTPLTLEGCHATYHLINDGFLSQISPSAIVINSARGGLMNTQALLNAKASTPHLKYIIDVWEQEPHISRELLACASIATPHIAGYSWDAKVEATRRVYQATCEHFGIQPLWDGPADAPAYKSPLQQIESLSIDELRSYVQSTSALREDAAALRSITSVDNGSFGTQFDTLRNSYAPRREFSQGQITQFY
jgi:erythronate-4-phosphate dehydrogenase